MIVQEKVLIKFLSHLFKSSKIEEFSLGSKLNFKVIKISRQLPLLLIDNQSKSFQISTMGKTLINNTFGPIDHIHICRLCQPIVYEKFKLYLDDHTIIE